MFNINLNPASNCYTVRLSIYFQYTLCKQMNLNFSKVKLKKVDHVLKVLDTSPVKGSLEIIPFRVKQFYCMKLTLICVIKFSLCIYFY